MYLKQPKRKMKLINYIASIFSKKRGIVEVNETSPLDKALLVNLEKFELSNEETVFLDLLFKILDQDKKSNGSYSTNIFLNLIYLLKIVRFQLTLKQRFQLLLLEEEVEFLN